MNEKQLSQIKWYFVGFITLTIWAMLIWQYVHDGVPIHHLLHRADLPGISNWWGGLLLPVLSWVLLGRIQTRILKSPPEKASLLAKQIAISFVITLFYGAMLSISFLNGYAEISSVMFPGILFFAIFFKVYREEFILGFILSMSITFGAVLSTTFGSLAAVSSAIVYFVVQFIWLRIKNITSAKQTS
ncbi:hypothetical protein AADZ86_13645 [Colwelliaceae bacterium BS250]